MSDSPWTLRGLGTIMRPDPTDPREAAGVLNPAAARGPDGHLYLLPRLVAAGNYSRIGLARVLFDERGDPVGVKRLGIVLEPQAPYELNARTGGGVEDPRVTYCAERGQYAMTYTAYGPAGPRIAVAVSHDLRRWRRTGLVRFAPLHGRDLGAVPNKDGLLFPAPVAAPDGRSALALIHRPMGDLSPCDEAHVLPPEVRSGSSMWISYAPLDESRTGEHIMFGQHHRLAGPEQEWEWLKVGGGTPPVRVGEVWLVLYHGVQWPVGGLRSHRDARYRLRSPQHLRYSAGALLLDVRDPRRVLYRSAHSILAPKGAASAVVFPTGLDVRADGTLDVYYGLGDRRIGVARAHLADLRAGADTRDVADDDGPPRIN